MTSIIEDKQIIWKGSIAYWGGFGVILFLLIYIYYDALALMVDTWSTKEEYGHGYLIPIIVAFLIWQRKDQLESTNFQGSWIGILLVMLGVFVFYGGKLSSIYTLMQYAFLVTLYGAVLSIIGKKALKIVIAPLIILFFMVPLPSFLFFNLSSQLQLISSQIGVAVIRLFDISVFLEGNVIDLGVYQLQVVEACSGLNYLFPLMTLAFISAYFFTGTLWKKAIIFLSSIPITILMNSFRIGAIGIMVEYWGIEMAEGFLHDFEGWAVFMCCIAILVCEMWILAKIGKNKLQLREAFGLDFPEPTPADAEITYREVPKQFYASLMIITLVAASVLVLPEREEIIPDRKQYAVFPLEFEGWVGRAGHLEQIYIDVLKLSDYAMYDYRGEGGGSVNFYSAYYDSQIKGNVAHSPRRCIPGGGWRISRLENHNIQGVSIGNVPLVVNRLLIEKGESKQLVYYWFQQRGRIITNEYMMKWYLFWDAMTKSRTDGALMRLTTVLNPGQDIEIADDRLELFAKEISPVIPEYVPQ